jgi:phage tail sheath protein FI
MPATLSYPGVYIEEIPSGVRTITGVPTSITAFIGRAARGPMNEAVTINSFGDFERRFGGLHEEFLMSYAVRDFYSNGGSQAIIVRLIHPNFSTDADFLSGFAAAQTVAVAATSAASPGAAKTAANNANSTIQGDASKSAAVKGAAKAVAAAVDAAVAAGATLDDVKAATASVLAAAQTVSDAATGAASPPTAKTAANGANSTIQGNVSNSAMVKSAAQAVSDAVDAAVAVVTPVPTMVTVTTAATSVLSAAQTVSGAANAATTAASAKTAANAANSAILGDANNSAQVKSGAKAVSDAVDAVITTGATLNDIITATKSAVAMAIPSSARLQLPASGTDFLTLEAASEGAWGNGLRARVDYDDLDKVGNRFAPLTAADLFNLTVHDMNSGATERFLSLTIKDTPRRVDRVLANGSSLAQVTATLPPTRPRETDDQTLPLTEAEKKIAPFSAKDVPPKRSVGVAPDDQGSDGAILEEIDFTGPGLQDNKRGLFALDKADLFNLLCIPPQERGGNTLKEIYQNALPYCQERRAMLIVDSPANWSQNPDQAAATAKSGLLTDLNLTGEQARNAALFFPRVIQSDPLHEGQLDTFVPCGIVAGVMARTDTTRGVWKAPAGIDAALNGIQGLEVNLTDAENGMLNPLGINCLRFFPVVGRVVWGARTLRGADQLADEYKYIPVRRTALFIEESLYRGTQWVVFEPNDEPLWAQIRLNLGAFMNNLFRQGAFQGKTPKDAYFVKCDKETTTQTDIDLGIVNILVGFAPLKPAEFVVIKLQQIAGQIQT